MSIKSYKNAHIKFLMQCYWQGYFKIQGKHVHMELITSTIPFSLRKQWSSRQKNKQQERHSNDLIAASTWLNELFDSNYFSKFRANHLIFKGLERGVEPLLFSDCIFLFFNCFLWKMERIYFNLVKSEFNLMSWK